MLPSSYVFEALGTQWEIATSQSIPPELIETINVRIDIFDKAYSRFRADSLVTKMSKRAGSYVFPNDVMLLLDFYRELYDITDGKVTPLIGKALELSGYDAEYSFSEKQQEPVPVWNDVLQVDGNILTTTQPIVLDVGAAGKGYLVDIIGSLLDQHDITDYVVDASGDLLHKGSIENRVGLEHPFQKDTVIGVIDVQNRSLCASAINRRSWGEGMHHVFDPDTVQPVSEIVATWVVTDTAMIADGLATALFFTDPELLSKQYDFEYVRMNKDGAIDYNHSFSGELF